jgi:Zn-dependent peptidase ImmA (M78 family)
MYILSTTKFEEYMLGDRLKQARIAAGLSLRDLAGKTGNYITAQAISKYENRQSTPGSAVLDKLSQALGLNVGYFFRDAEIDVQLSEPVYRKRPTIKTSTLKAISAKVKSRLEIYLEIEDMYPEKRFKKFSMPINNIRTIKRSKDIEKLANWLRRDWELGNNPIGNLTRTLEDRGLKVVTIEASEDIDGFSCWANNTIPVIVVNGKFPTDRLRFSIAHELGHLLIRTSDSDNIERYANRFAGAFLVPEEVVITELGKKRININWQELMLLREKYGMSVQAWIYRMRELKVISESYAGSLFRYLRRNKLYDKELGNPLPAERNGRYEFLVVQAVEQGIISEAKGAELLNTPLNEFTRNIGIPLKEMLIYEQ